MLVGGVAVRIHPNDLGCKSFSIDALLTELAPDFRVVASVAERRLDSGGCLLACLQLRLQH
jgi:hypothetical protein